MTENSKATTKPWFSRLLRHPTKKRSDLVYSGTQNTHIFTYLLTFPGPTRDRLLRRATYVFFWMHRCDANYGVCRPQLQRQMSAVHASMTWWCGCGLIDFRLGLRLSGARRDMRITNHYVIPDTETHLVV